MAPYDSGRSVAGLLAIGLALLVPGCGRTPEPAAAKHTGAPKAGTSTNTVPEAPASAPSSAASVIAALDEVDACTFLTPEEIREAVGKPVVTTNHGPIQRPGVCQFELGNRDQIVLTIYSTAGRGAYAAAVGEEVTDLGEAAKINLQLGVITVLKGETSFALSVLAGAPDDRVLREQLLLLARKVLDRLG